MHCSLGVAILGKLDRHCNVIGLNPPPLGAIRLNTKAHASQGRMKRIPSMSNLFPFLWIRGVRPSEEKYLGLLRTGVFRVWSSLGVTCINYAAGRKLSEVGGWPVGGSLAKTAHLGSHGIPREPPCLDKRHSLNPGDIKT